jgi:hypothetical protein
LRPATDEFVQIINCLARTAVGREFRDKSLEFVRVEPQPMTTRTPVERERPYNYFVQGLVAAWAEMFAACGNGAGLALELQNRVVVVGTRARHDFFQFACVQPEAPTTFAEINIDTFEMKDQQPHIALGTYGDHIALLLMMPLG